MADDRGKPGIRDRLRKSGLLTRDFSILMSALVVVSLGFGLLAPIMPELARNLGITDGAMGGIFALYFVALVLALPPSGYLADKVGRKKMIIGGLIVFSVTTFGLAFVTDALQFAVLRAIEGVGAAMVAPATFALTIDIVPEDKRATAMGIEGTVQMIGIFAGPAIGGYIAGEINFIYPFYLGAGLSVLCAIIVSSIKEPARSQSDEHPSLFTMFGAWKRNVQANRTLIALTVRGLVMGIVQGLFMLGLILYWYDEISMSLTEVGIAMSIGTAVMAAGTLYFGTLSDKHGRVPFILIGGAIMATGLAGMIFAENVMHIYILMAISELGAAISNPSVGALLADTMLKEERGRVMGAYQTVQGIGNILGLTGLSIVYARISHDAPIIVGAAALALATAIIAIYVRDKKRLPATGANSTSTNITAIRSTPKDE
ncbi:MAG: MFS transporter [Candidatus Thermoplasmatota archaeon]|nr:MFS transporter [Candidatus Thermoplasmatota archaeon]